ncbi:hypothetical protein JCM33374_g5001 [Metschnikowia sp. JCM 33374]|nr:hypothetical protein JCM33374_g5001 [Metschnikowia sp. JCM 33374]
MVTTTSKNQEFPDPDPTPRTRVILGYEIPEHMVEKAGPFLLGMVTTYALQILMPIFLYYTSVTARFLSVAFMWLSLSGVICWYAGLLNPQALDLQLSVSRIISRLSPNNNGPEVSGASAKDDRPGESTEQLTSRSAMLDSPEDKGHPSYIRYNPRSIAEREQLEPSPIITSRNPLPRSQAERESLEPSPVIASRSTMPRSQSERPHSERSHVEIEQLQPAPIIHSRPAYPRSKTDKDELNPAPTINVRPFITPIREAPRKTQSELQIPQKAAKSTKPASKERPVSEKKGSETSILRHLIHPRSTRRPTSINVVETATESSSITRRSSSGSSGSDKSDSKKNKPLPEVANIELHDPDYTKPRSMDPYIEDKHMAPLARSNSITSKASVLGTRANYSKFLANVNK